MALDPERAEAVDTLMRLAVRLTVQAATDAADTAAAAAGVPEDQRRRLRELLTAGERELAGRVMTLMGGAAV